MLCGNCQALVRELTGQSAPQTWLKKAVPAGLEPLRMFLCEQCLALLPAADSTDLLLRTLSRLARFGLGAQTRPLLTAGKGSAESANASRRGMPKAKGTGFQE
ncbi:MAG: hypothetical protein DIU52_006690 [bacterium]|jgi:hypothetical protein|nr:MAG: hypothetical protein DIU52_00645 [bacterium]